MNNTSVIVLAMLASVGSHASCRAGSLLGSTERFAVLAGSTVTNTGPSIVNGDLGVSPGTAVTGFPPGIVSGTMHLNDGIAQTAQSDLTTAYNTLVVMTPTTNLTDQDLGGMTLAPGVYFFASAAQLTGALTLSGIGDFVFQIGSTLTTASASSVLTINGADGCDVYWQVGSSATLGTATAFEGSILAQASITLTTGANILDGRALARDGAVTMDTNTIDSCVVVPAPATAGLGFIGCAGFKCCRPRRARRNNSANERSE